MKQLLLLLISVLVSFNSWSQNKHTISGRVKDMGGEELIGATVYVKNIKTGTVTNVYGFYSITLREGTYQVDYSYVGYETQTQTINLNQNQSLNVTLSETSNDIDEVIVTAKRKNENVVKAEMSTMKLQAKELKKIPAFMGEVDIIKAIQMMPGVQASSEGSSGFHGEVSCINL